MLRCFTAFLYTYKQTVLPDYSKLLRLLLQFNDHVHRNYASCDQLKNKELHPCNLLSLETILTMNTLKKKIDAHIVKTEPIGLLHSSFAMDYFMNQVKYSIANK